MALFYANVIQTISTQTTEANMAFPSNSICFTVVIHCISIKDLFTLCQEVDHTYEYLFWMLQLKAHIYPKE